MFLPARFFMFLNTTRPHKTASQALVTAPCIVCCAFHHPQHNQKLSYRYFSLPKNHPHTFSSSLLPSKHTQTSTAFPALSQIFHTHRSRKPINHHTHMLRSHRTARTTTPTDTTSRRLPSFFSSVSLRLCACDSTGYPLSLSLSLSQLTARSLLPGVKTFRLSHTCCCCCKLGLACYGAFASRQCLDILRRVRKHFL